MATASYRAHTSEKNPIVSEDEMREIDQYYDEHLTQLRFQNPTIDSPISPTNWKENKADTLRDKSFLLVNAITPEKAFSATLPEITSSLERLDKIERLERGQATENIDVMLASIEKLTNKRLRKQTDTTDITDIAGITEDNICEEVAHDREHTVIEVECTYEPPEIDVFA